MTMNADQSPETAPGLPIPKAVLDAILALLSAIDSDENRSGGLLQRATHRRAGELRLALSVALIGSTLGKVSKVGEE